MRAVPCTEDCHHVVPAQILCAVRGSLYRVQTNLLFAQDDEALAGPFVWIIMFWVIAEFSKRNCPTTYYYWSVCLFDFFFFNVGSVRKTFLSSWIQLQFICSQKR